MSNRTTKALLQAAKKQGWRVRLTNGGHYVLLSPAGARVIIANTPSDSHAYLNARARLRREGLKI